MKRHILKQVELPPLAQVVNRVEAIFDAAEPKREIKDDQQN